MISYSKAISYYLWYLIIDKRIDGDAFKDLDESALRGLGVTYGYRHKLLNIVANLV